MNSMVKKIFTMLLEPIGLELRFKKDQGLNHGFNHMFERLEHYKKLGFHPEVILDIGASNGFFTKKCLNIFPDSKYMCVEPQKEHLKKLEKLKTKTPNVEFWQGCLGSEFKTAVLNVDGDGSSILTGHNNNPYGEQREIIVETAEKLIESGTFLKPDFIKVDVQGYEIEVLKGFGKHLQNIEAVLLEASFFKFQTGMPIIQEVLEYMKINGFVLRDIFSLSTRPLDGSAAQTDLFFLREGHPLTADIKWDKNSIY